MSQKSNLTIGKIQRFFFRKRLHLHYCLDLHPHPVTVANEGLVWDSLLKMVIILVVTGILGGGRPKLLRHFLQVPTSFQEISQSGESFLLFTSQPFSENQALFCRKNSLEDEQQKVLKNDACKL